MTFSYAYFTRKQANIIYAAWKDGRISMDKSDISAIYDIVDRRELSYEQRNVQFRAENIVKWLMEERDDYAQAIADGYYVVEAYETRIRLATEDDWFYEPGEEITENVFIGYEVLTPEDYRARRNW